jgi:T4-like virus tail tube protein gp19
MRTAFGRSLATCAGVAIAVTFPGLISAQVPTRSSEPRLAVPTTETTIAPTTVAPAPEATAPTTTASPDTTSSGGVTQYTGTSSGVTQVGGGTTAEQTSTSSQAIIGTQSYTVSRSALLIEGAQIIPKSVEGGVPLGKVVTDAATNTKHLAGVEYEEISAEVGIGTKSPLLDWVAQSWKGTALRKSGSIVDLNFDYKAVGEREFKDALITQTTIPTLDAASKEAAYFTVKLAPTSIRQSAGSGTVLKSSLTQKTWLASGFRFEMDGLDGKGVARIESFSVGQPAATDNVGETRDYEKQAGKLVFPNLKISLNQSSASTWSQWFNDFVVMGNNGDDREKKGGIAFLDPYLKELGRVNLFNCGIFRLAPTKAVATDAIKRVTAELYCERMELAVF